ncbi:MAG: nuclear transport factor 2 family protein [Burkholderiales bacterium]|nr:nuclear transport factor 2 family protein [Burkholderiales bacterium]
MIERLVLDFTDAFNRNDLECVMSYFTENAVYQEFNGTVNRGRAAIRGAFEPQFRGQFGVMKFHTEDLFVDAPAGKALIRWLCTLHTKRGPAGWRGLDILHFENGRISEKHTYAKAVVPRLDPVGEE